MILKSLFIPRQIGKRISFPSSGTFVSTTRRMEPDMVFALRCVRPLVGAALVLSLASRIAADEPVPAAQLFESYFTGWSDPPAVRMTIENQMRQELIYLNRIVSLNKTQKSKLELAGRLDAERFIAEINAVRFSVPVGEAAAVEVARIVTQAHEVQRRLIAGVHNDKSLFQKAILTTLDEKQRRLFDEHIVENAPTWHRTQVRQMLWIFDPRNTMTAAQRTDLEALLQVHTKPPRRSPALRGLELRFVRALDKISEEEWKKIFDGAQLERVKVVLAQLRTAADAREIADSADP